LYHTPWVCRSLMSRDQTHLNRGEERRQEEKEGKKHGRRRTERESRKSKETILEADRRGELAIGS